VTQTHDERETFLREVDDEHRRDQFLEIWRKYGYVFVAVAVLAVGGVAGVNYWRNYQLDRNKAFGSQFVGAQVLARESKFDQAAQVFASVAANGPDGYRIIGALARAATLAKAGDADRAIALYDQIAGNNAVPAEFREAAALMAVRQLMDRASVEEIDRRLVTLNADSSLYRYSSRELTGLNVLRSGDVDTAKKIFRNLADDMAAPQGVRARATELVAALGG
jgi:hypothetical protein